MVFMLYFIIVIIIMLRGTVPVRFFSLNLNTVLYVPAGLPYPSLYLYRTRTADKLFSSGSTAPALAIQYKPRRI